MNSELQGIDVNLIKAQNASIRKAYNDLVSQVHDRKIVLESEVNRLIQEKNLVTENITKYKSRLQDLEIVAKALQTVIDKTCSDNLNRITSIVNLALSSVFPDQNLRFEIDVTVKRNIPNYELRIIQDGVSGSIDSFGGGVLSVVSVVLKIILNVMTKSAPIICLDETLSGLSVEYIPAMSALLREICRKFNIYLILVTHQDKFLVNCDYAYKVRAVPNSDESIVERVDSPNGSTCNTEEE